MMKYININGSKVSVIGLGTHLMGGRQEADYSEDDKYIEIIKKAISLGVNHLATAEVYGNGHTEELIGKAILGLDRKKLFITSMVWHDNLAHDKLMSSLKSSLKRLGTDYLDLYYIHYPNPDIPIKETMETLEEAKELGLIKNIGVSNFSVDQILEANSYFEKSKIVAVQAEYNLINKDSSKEILNLCQKEGIIFVAYKPFGKGLVFKSNNILLEDLVNKYKKSKAQIALNWLLHQKNVIAIPKASSIGHLRDNVNSTDWVLEKEDFDLLSKAIFD